MAIQSRMSSSRLPGKSLMDLCGKPLIHRVYDACEASAWDRYVLTTCEQTDYPLVDYLKAQQIPHRRGSLENVLSRYMALVEEIAPTVLVRICGDAPFIKRRWIFSAIEDVETYGRPVFVPGALHAGTAEHWERCAKEATNGDHEHAGHDWFELYGRTVRCVPEHYFSVNTPEDMEKARALWELKR